MTEFLVAMYYIQRTLIETMVPCTYHLFSAFLGLRDFFSIPALRKPLAFILEHRNIGLNSETNKVWLYFHRLRTHL